MKIRLCVILLLAAGQLIPQTEAVAARIILDTVTDSGTTISGCRKRKTSSFLTIPSRSYHTMGIDSVHWVVRGGFVQGIHTGDNYGWVILGESSVVESDTARILPSYRGAEVHMETDYWAFFCGSAGGQMREINAHRKDSDEC